MESLKSRLSQVFSESFVSLGFEERWGEVTLSDRPDLAHYQCNGALGASKSQRKNPREVAQAVMDAVSKLSVDRLGADALELGIAGPGFINIKLSDEFLARETDALSGDARLGIPKVANPRTVVIDYGGPNVAKTMHVGHLRSSIIGESLMRLHRFMGDHPIGDDHLGDWGTPMGMLIISLKEKHPELPYFDPVYSGEYPVESPVVIEDLEAMYPVAAKRFKEDPAFAAEALKATHELQSGRRGYKSLWQHFAQTTIRDLNRDFGSLDIQFDHHLGESFYEDKMPPLVEKLKQKGITEMSEGALIIPIATEKDPETPPVILVKSGGGFLYHTSDLATIEYRVNHFKADLVLYVVDKRQSLHFKQVFAAARKAGITGQAVLIHTGFGTMNGKDGKPFKTREGGVIKLKELIRMVNEEAKKRLRELEMDKEYTPDQLEEIAHKVGIAALKFGDLKNNRIADYVFDLERFAQFEGHTGPYLLYAAVRIKSILRKAGDLGFKPGPILVATVPSERDLQLHLHRLPDSISRAYSGSEPHHLADYGFSLSQAFNTFYKDCHILREENPARRASWLNLCKTTHDQLVLCLGLLGIQVPEKM